jgi:CRISPR/Cas system CSM-associated protein Csm3 (group 7 of RAMP superfamily)
VAKQLDADFADSDKTGIRPIHRFLSERLVISGQLVLTSPAHFGNGDADPFTDLPLLRDETDGRALITGASLAGALRSYLREYQLGYASRDPQSPYYRDGISTENYLLATDLFGGYRGDDKGAQSPLIVDDALSGDAVLIELRDGVAIDPKSRTALKKKKYDFQILPAGTIFELRFELLLDDKPELNARRKLALALALQALSAGEIALGSRKRRGFGCCEVKSWTVTRYELQSSVDLLAWIASDHPDWPRKSHPEPTSGADIATLMGIKLAEREVFDRRNLFTATIRFSIDGSLIIRYASAGGTDAQHLHSYSPKAQRSVPILSGTSIAGIMRHRALRILNTLAGGGPEIAPSVTHFIDDLFGPVNIDSQSEARASRVSVAESIIEGGHSLVQTRIKIDRFTGSTIQGALLEEAPYFGGEVTMHFSLRNPQPAEIGVLLLVLKDLWLGDLPIGGESGVGRGRLRGIWAKFTNTGPASFQATWKASGEPGELEQLDAATVAVLEEGVADLLKINWVEGA